MLEKFLWFALGYGVARYLILKNGVETYVAKEQSLINKGKEVKENIEDQIETGQVEYTPFG